MDALDRIGMILNNSKFWAALWLLIQALIAQFAPDFPPALMAAINLFVASTFAIAFAADVGEQRANAKYGAALRMARWGNDSEDADDEAADNDAAK